MKVVCIDNMGGLFSLTIKKYYNVIDKNDSGFKILNDIGTIYWYSPLRFKPIEDDRNDKLNKLLLK